MKYTIVLTTDTEPEIVEPILNEALNAFSLALQEIGGPSQPGYSQWSLTCVRCGELYSRMYALRLS
jgi:hypothetical protein